MRVPNVLLIQYTAQEALRSAGKPVLESVPPEKRVFEWCLVVRSSTHLTKPQITSTVCTIQHYILLVRRRYPKSFDGSIFFVNQQFSGFEANHRTVVIGNTQFSCRTNETETLRMFCWNVAFGTRICQRLSYCLHMVENTAFQSVCGLLTRKPSSKTCFSRKTTLRTVLVAFWAVWRASWAAYRVW